VTDVTARAIHGAPTEDQIVTATARATAFHASGGWMGLTARYVDRENYYFALLSSSGKVSLRRRLNGQTAILDEAPFAVAAGSSYLLRLDAIGSALRLYVTGRLQCEADDASLARGRYGLTTYRVAADFDQFNASRP
jgi:hypothetical protein